jgi:hypothetical protein
MIRLAKTKKKPILKIFADYRRARLAMMNCLLFGYKLKTGVCESLNAPQF